MANEIIHYPGSSWPDVVAAAEGYKNGIPESRLSQEVQLKLNADKKPVGGWTEADFSTSVQKLLHLAGGFADNDESASTGTRNVNIDGYMLTAGALVSVRFANAVPAGASLRISPDGGSTYTTRKNIWYDGGLLPADTIKAGMTVSFRYDGEHYQVVAMIPAAGSGLVETDPTLSIPGAAADAKAAGEAVGRVFYQSAKMKLLEILRGVGAWSISGADALIDELEDELFPEGEIVSIEAVYTQDGAVVYANTPLDALRADLVVTATLSDSTTKVITDYTLIGTLTAGTSTVTVKYRDLTDTFSVSVTAAPTETSITALYTQGSTVVTPYTPINSLKSDLVVMVNYSNTTSRQLDPTEYTLSGTLTEGTSTVDVAYHGFTDEFTVTVGPAPTVPAEFDSDGLICCIDGKQINDNLWYNLVTGVPFVLHNVTVEQDGVTFAGTADSYGESTETFGSGLTIEVVYKAAADSGNYAFFGTHQVSNGALCLMHSKTSGKIFSAYNNSSKTVHVTPVAQIGMLSATRGDSNSPAQIAVLNGTTVSNTANDYTNYPSSGIEGSKIGTHGFSSMMFKGEILMVNIYNKRKTAAEMQANQAIYDSYYNMGILNQS